MSGDIRERQVDPTMCNLVDRPPNKDNCREGPQKANRSLGETFVMKFVGLGKLAELFPDHCPVLRRSASETSLLENVKRRIPSGNHLMEALQHSLVRPQLGGRRQRPRSCCLHGRRKARLTVLIAQGLCHEKLAIGVGTADCKL